MVIWKVLAPRLRTAIMKSKTFQLALLEAENARLSPEMLLEVGKLSAELLCGHAWQN